MIRIDDAGGCLGYCTLAWGASLRRTQYRLQRVSNGLILLQAEQKTRLISTPEKSPGPSSSTQVLSYALA
jgi:hypothetical protein